MAFYKDSGGDFEALFPADPGPPAAPAITRASAGKVTASGKRFSKFIVRYCIIAVSLFTVTVLVYNWTGRLVQPELIAGFITAFAVHLVTVAWVTAVKEKAEHNGQGI